MLFRALIAIVNNIQQRINKPRLIFATEPYTSYYRQNPTKAKAINEAIRWVASEYNCPIIDLEKISNINSNNVNELTYDGVHPNPEGINRIKYKVARFILDNI